MASERQVAANRRNAKGSTGPRSQGGKVRSSKNAYRHGLAGRKTHTEAAARAIERLTRKLIASNKSVVVRHLAEVAAEEQITITRVRSVKAALIENIALLAASESNHAQSDEMKGLPIKQPTVGAEAEAVQRALPELKRLDRYEERASSRRNRAINLILETLAKNNLT